MARGRPVRILIYEEDVKFIEESTSKYPNIETGGDLFGLWQSESEVVVQLVTGPGENCRRTQTSFYQDTAYLSNVGGYLTSEKGLCNIGAWHSHHSLNIPEPSSGDRSTVFRNMPGQGLKRFLVIIATIQRNGCVEMNGFMFCMSESGHREMIRVRGRILDGPNPFRKLSEVMAKVRDGEEIPYVRDISKNIAIDTEITDSANQDEQKLSKKENKKLKKEKRKLKKERKEREKAEEERIKQEARHKQGISKDESNDNRGKKHNIFLRKKKYSQLKADGVTSGTFKHNKSSDFMPNESTSVQSANNVDIYNKSSPFTDNKTRDNQENNEREFHAANNYHRISRTSTYV